MRSCRDCPGLPAPLLQVEDPDWTPLFDAVGERLAPGFMWMHESRFPDGTPLHAYKHIITRRYLYLTDGRHAFQRQFCLRYAPYRVDFAIEAALCTWWMLGDWEQEDLDALRDAVMRAQDTRGGGP